MKKCFWSLAVGIAYGSFFLYVSGIRDPLVGVFCLLICVAVMYVAYWAGGVSGEPTKDDSEK